MQRTAGSAYSGGRKTNKCAYQYVDVIEVIVLDVLVVQIRLITERTKEFHDISVPDLNSEVGFEALVASPVDAIEERNHLKKKGQIIPALVKRPSCVIC